MKRLHKTMLVLCVTVLLVLSSGVALGVVKNDLGNNATDTDASNKTNVTATETPIKPVYTTTEPVETTVKPVATKTETIPIPKETSKSPGFEIVLTIGVLCAIYIRKKKIR